MTDDGGPRPAERVAMLGLGRMGAAIADRLAGAGADLVVWNRSPQAVEPFASRGVEVAASPAEAASRAGVVVTMLADAAAVEAVVLGADGVVDGAARAARTPVLVEMSTIDAPQSARLAAALAGTGIGYLRAPVSGNPSVVAAGRLAILVSGAAADLERAGPVLAAIGPRVWHLGAGEEARVLKLALNAMVAGTSQLLAEALVLCEAHGLARDAVLGVIGGSAVGSPFVAYKTPALVAGDLTATFTVEFMRKDVTLALEAADAAGVELPAAALVRELLGECIDEGRGEEDLMALLPRLEARSL